MQQISTITGTYTGTNKIKITGTDKDTSIQVTSKRAGQSNFDYECDQLYEEFKDLCGDTRFRPYYIKSFYAIGKDRVIQLAGIAKADNSNFGWLVKKELQNGHSQ